MVENCEDRHGCFGEWDASCILYCVEQYFMQIQVVHVHYTF